MAQWSHQHFVLAGAVSSPAAAVRCGECSFGPRSSRLLDSRPRPEREVIGPGLGKIRFPSATLPRTYNSAGKFQRKQAQRSPTVRAPATRRAAVQTADPPATQKCWCDHLGHSLWTPCPPVDCALIKLAPPLPDPQV